MLHSTAHSLADPGHRIKSMAKPVFALAKAALAVSIIKMCDAMQHRMYVGYCVKICELSFEQFKKMEAPVEHIFGSHKWCDREWC